MIKISITVLMLIATCMIGWSAQKASAKKTALSESELRAFAKAVPNVKTGGTLYSVAMATSNDVNRQQQLLKASSACLIACGKEDVYKKHAKGKLQNVEEFERNLKDNCKRCAGTGKMDRRCHVCISVKGKCQRCKGSGKVRSVGFNRPDTWNACGQCNGNGQCRKCGGNGYLKEKCLVCTGTGRVFSADVSTRVFRDLCHAIADSMAVPRNTNSSASQSAKMSKGTPETRKVGVASHNTNPSATQSPKTPKGTPETHKIEERFAKRCYIGTDDRSVEVGYCDITYGVYKNTDKGENFVVLANRKNSDDYFAYSFMMFTMIQARDRWYASVEKCVEKLRNWVLVSKQNKIKEAEKEIPGTAIKGVSHFIVTKGEGAFKVMRKAIHKPIPPEYLGDELKFTGFVEAQSDKFDRYRVSLFAKCGDFFHREIFRAYGTIEEIDREIAEFLIFVNPESFVRVREKRAKEQSLFQ